MYYVSTQICHEVHVYPHLVSVAYFPVFFATCSFSFELCLQIAAVHLKV